MFESVKVVCKLCKTFASKKWFSNFMSLRTPFTAPKTLRFVNVFAIIEKLDFVAS